MVIVNDVDGLHSVKFDPPILNFSEKPICMQWANVFFVYHWFIVLEVFYSQ